MEKQLRSSPRTSGASQRSCCSPRAVLEEELHVAGVGRLAVEDVVAEGAPAEHLADMGELGERQPGAPEVARHVEGGEPLVARPLAQAIQLAKDGSEAVLQEGALDRQHIGIEEGAGGVGGLPGPGGYREVHPGNRHQGRRGRQPPSVGERLQKGVQLAIDSCR